MVARSQKSPRRDLELLRSLTPGAYRIRRDITIVLAVCPPLLCALFVSGPDHWSLFERSGSLTAAIGLLLASRQYLKPGNLEVAVLNRANSANSNLVELVEETRCHKLGLAISAFGSIVMGWGSYLRWWTFSYLVVWAAIAAYDAWRDFVRLRDAPIGVPSTEEDAGAADAG